MHGNREQRWNARLALVIGAAGLVLGYLTFALAAGWTPFSPGPSVRIDVAESRLNASGRDDPADEYVCLVAEDDDVELTGWQLRDAERIAQVLPHFTLAAGTSVRVHPGRGRDTPTDLYGTEGSAVWNNDGDTIALLDEDGGEVASATYGVQPESGGPTCGPRPAS